MAFSWSNINTIFSYLPCSYSISSPCLGNRKLSALFASGSKQTQYKPWELLCGAYHDSVSHSLEFITEMWQRWEICRPFSVFVFQTPCEGWQKNVLILQLFTGMWLCSKIMFGVCIWVVFFFLKWTSVILFWSRISEPNWARLLGFLHYFCRVTNGACLCQLLVDWLTSHYSPPTVVLAQRVSWVCHSPPTSVLALKGSWVWRVGSGSACSVHMAYGSSRSRDISLSGSNQLLLTASYSLGGIWGRQAVWHVPLRMVSHSSLVFQTAVFISWCLPYFYDMRL